MELLQRENPRTKRLSEYLGLLIDKQAGKAAFQTYEADLHSTNPFEVNDVLDHILSSCEDVESLAVPVSQFIRAVGKSLEACQKPAYPTGHLLHSLSVENRELKEFSSHMQKLSLAIQQGERRSTNSTEDRPTAENPGQSKSLETLKALIASNDTLSSHYVRLQNELFPLFEAVEAHHSCVKLMWALQSRTLALRKEVLSVQSSLAEFWKLFGQFYFHVRILLYREEHILFPVAFRSIPIERATEKGIPTGSQGDKQVRLQPELFVSPTGSLDHAVLEQVFRLLPLDIAFIGSDDRLQFYSDPPHRIFPRSPQLIGRLVQNCHPPKSVAVVEKILTSFKEGREDSAEFYLSIGGKFIHIEYYAVRNREHSYLGTLEVTQDATHLRELVGEKRLL